MKLNYLVYREENPGSVMKLVKEKAPSFHMLIIIHSPSQNGLRLAAELIRGSIIDRHAVILLCSDPTNENYSLSRNLGIDYYIEDPYEPYHFMEAFQKHFPGLGREELKKAPELDQVNPDLSILLAEDNLFNRKLIQGLFKRLCLEIDFAENGAQAVQMAKDKKYDIIFMDLLMPEMDGIQAAAEIRKQGTVVPIVALTAVEDSETRNAAMEAGFDDYLIKPASAEKLRKTLLKNCSKTS
jgi:CheY-like chemotaxis protein